MLLAEAVAAIERAGGSSCNRVIVFPTEATVSEEARRAIEFLVSEWDFSVAYEEELDVDV